MAPLRWRLSSVCLASRRAMGALLWGLWMEPVSKGCCSKPALAQHSLEWLCQTCCEVSLQSQAQPGCGKHHVSSQLIACAPHKSSHTT